MKNTEGVTNSMMVDWISSGGVGQALAEANLQATTDGWASLTGSHYEPALDAAMSAGSRSYSTICGSEHVDAELSAAAGSGAFNCRL